MTSLATFSLDFSFSAASLSKAVAAERLKVLFYYTSSGKKRKSFLSATRNIEFEVVYSTEVTISIEFTVLSASVTEQTSS